MNREAQLEDRTRKLDHRQVSLDEREADLEERERALADRERVVQDQRDVMRSERNRLAAALGLRRDSSSSEEDYGEVIEEGDVVDERANLENIPPRPVVEVPTLVKMASRQSLVPRRPLEERRST